MTVNEMCHKTHALFVQVVADLVAVFTFLSFSSQIHVQVVIGWLKQTDFESSLHGRSQENPVFPT